jgi:hypothetical protein
VTLTQAVAAFLVAADVIEDQSVFFEGEEWPEIGQDVALVIDQVPGVGELYERTYDGIGIQIQSRGGQEDPAGAEELATAVDNAVLAPPSAFTMGAFRVLSTQRIGGPPRLLSIDPSHRRVFSANYLFTVARTQF